MTTTETIVNGNQAVVITQQDDKVWANLYVNARYGLADATITATRWKGKALKGAMKWANGILGL